MTTAAILSIGTEITRGELTNSNASWLAEKLTDVGYDVIEHVSVADDLDTMQSTMSRLSQRVHVMVCTGGLGPTSDDMTREAVSKLLNIELVHDAESLRAIEARFRARNMPMPAINRNQALVPKDARVLKNTEGTAPGFALSIGGMFSIFMPGVPREMKAMFEPLLAELSARVQRTTHQIHLRTFGNTESQVAEKLEGVEQALPGVTIGYRAHFPDIEVKVFARAEDDARARMLAERGVVMVRERLGDIVYAEGRNDLPRVVFEILRAQKKTLAFAESCTGGKLASLLTEIAGSSEVFLLSAVTYSNQAKSTLLGVPSVLLEGPSAPGAVSAEVAIAMAEGALRISGSDLALSVTGIAGPGGGSDAKPVGTVHFGLARRDKPTQSFHYVFRWDRGRNQRLSCWTGLKIVLDAITNDPST